MEKQIKYCATCGNRVPTNTQQDACVFHSTANHIHIIHNPEEEYCYAYTDTPKMESCDICQANVNRTDGIIIYDEDKVEIFCATCYTHLNTCKTCGDSRSCDFITNPIPIPQQVMKTFKRGNSVIQTMIQNPDRIAETCEKNCKCWDHEHSYCRKEVDDWCPHYNRNEQH